MKEAQNKMKNLVIRVFDEGRSTVREIRGAYEGELDWDTEISWKDNQNHTTISLYGTIIQDLTREFKGLQSYSLEVENNFNLDFELGESGTARNPEQMRELRGKYGERVGGTSK